MNPMQYIRERIWSELPQQVTPRQRVTAALLWGGALLVWGALKAWRLRHGHGGSLTPAALTAAAGVVLAGVLLLPSLGESVYLGVMRFFSVIGFFVSTVIFTIAFYILVTPMGWALRLAGKDILDIRPGGKPAWHDHKTPGGRKRYYRLS